MAYQTNEIEDWWKHHYNETYNGQALSSKPDTMSDADFRIGQQLYNSYVQGNKYQTDYNNAVADSAKRTEAAKISADVSRQRLEKYLPQQLALQGLYGTGMSEDSYLKLQNQYQKAVGDANAMHNQNLKDYKSTLDSQNHALWQQTTGAVNDIVDDEKEEQEKIKAEQQAAFEEAYMALNPSMLTSADDVDTILGQYKEKMSDTQYNNLERYAETVKDDIAQIEKQKELAPGHTLVPNDYDSLGNGDDVTITIGGNKYVIESDGESSNGAALEYAEENVDNGEVFLYNGIVYIYNNEKIYKLWSKSNSDDDRAEYNAVKHYLLYGEDLNANTTTTKNGQDSTSMSSNTFENSSQSAKNR